MVGKRMKGRMAALVLAALTAGVPVVGAVAQVIAPGPQASAGPASTPKALPPPSGSPSALRPCRMPAAPARRSGSAQMLFRPSRR